MRVERRARNGSRQLKRLESEQRGEDGNMESSVSVRVRRQRDIRQRTKKRISRKTWWRQSWQLPHGTDSLTQRLVHPNGAKGTYLVTSVAPGSECFGEVSNAVEPLVPDAVDKVDQ